MGDFFIQPDECIKQVENLKQVKAKLQSAKQQIEALRKEISRTQTDETLSRALQSVADELKAQETTSEAMGNALNTIVGLYKKTDGELEFKEQYLTTKQKNNKTDADSLDQWLDPDYKLSKEEKKKTKDMLDDYFAEGTTAKNLLDTNNPNYAMVFRNSMSDAELAQYQKMIALRNKTGLLSSITAGILGGTFLGSLQDMLNEYLSKAEGYTFLDTSKSSSLYANSLSQHKLGTLAGAFAANVALWELGSEALGGISKTLKGGGKVAESTLETGSKAAENVIEGSGNAVKGKGAFNGEVANGEGFGKLANKEITVTQKGLDKVKTHISNNGFDAPENSAMINRIEAALKNGEKITGADASYYMHELKESTLMSKGLLYEEAHVAALETYQVSPFSVYHPEVIQLNPSAWGKSWFNFWEIKK